VQYSFHVYEYQGKIVAVNKTSDLCTETEERNKERNRLKSVESHCTTVDKTVTWNAVLLATEY